MEGRTPSSVHAMRSGAFRAGADEGVRLFFVALVFVLLLSPTLFAIPRVAGVVEPEAAIGRTLTLKVEGDPGPCQSLILFIQRSPIHGLAPRCGNGTVAFNLAANDRNATQWHRILGGHWFTRTVTVGLGPNDQFPFPSLVTEEPFHIIRPWRVVVMFAVALALLAATFLVHRLTSALDSLARIQIALWVVIIGVSYVYIWSITGETETITAGALALLAIGAGTAVGTTILGTKTRVADGAGAVLPRGLALRAGEALGIIPFGITAEA